MTEPVRAQYEGYPYPHRDPKDEAKRLVTGSPSHLREIEHYLFDGRLPKERPFKVLIAGGGTGDGLIMLAQQLTDAGVKAEITYLDLSEAARAIAAARAEARGLGAIRFLTGSLRDLAELAPGPYHYIDCCGVLHHLDAPDAGLKTLAAQLAPEGGMGLMVYGALGRTGVYPVQEMLRQIAPAAAAGGPPDAARLRLARRLLAALPATNWLRRNPLIADHLRGDDAGLFDLLLHAADRPFSVPELAALVDGAGLAITGFIEPARYDPASYLSDPALMKPLAGLDGLHRAAFAERLAGNMKTHVCYVAPKARAADVVARPDGPDAVPVFRELDGPTLAKGLTPGRPLMVEDAGIRFRFPLPRLAAAIAQRIDGTRSLADI
ncbi:MAG: class I SAM-dependent methyltransferase, partial [Kiloniellales bacterium]